MFSITGTILNVFRQPGGKGKDGKAFDESHKVQIQGKSILKSGETRLELMTLTIPPKFVDDIKKQLGVEVTLPCGVFVSDGKITAFLQG